MASLRKRFKADGKTLASQYWWVRWKDPATQETRDESTKCVIGREDDLRRALKIKAGKILLELGAANANNLTRFDKWVPQFLRQHYSNPKSLQRVEGIWRNLYEYLVSIEIYGPETLKREHCQKYVEWREKRGHRRSKSKPINRNTIVLELKVLAFIMSEAVEREWIEATPTYRLGIERGRTQHRAELTSAHASIIRAAIQDRLKATNKPLTKPQHFEERRNAVFLHNSFEIASRQGIRVSETHFHLRDQVDWASGYLLLHAKGKEDYEAPLNPTLKPFLKDLLDQGHEWTYDPPRMPSLVWFKFMERLRAKHPELRKVSFHGTRVHVISQLHEAGAPDKVAMEMVNHASTTTHRIYRRVRHREIANFWPAVSSPVAIPLKAPEDISRPTARRKAASAPRSPKP